MASYQASQNTSLSESSRIQTLQRSISVHEVAIASLKKEFERQNKELVEAEEELSKLRSALAMKVRTQGKRGIAESSSKILM